MNTAALQPTRAYTVIGDSERHWTADELESACEAGLFGQEARLELIHGRVIEQMPQSSLHANFVEYLTNCLQAVLTPRFRVRDEKPLRLAFDGELVPDVVALRGRLTDLRQPHPTPEDVALLVEVAISSEGYDLGEKAMLYAQAGITDYWVVLPEREQIVVHRDPTPDGYQTTATAGPEAAVTPLAAEDVTLSVRDLLGLTGEESDT